VLTVSKRAKRAETRRNIMKSLVLSIWRGAEDGQYQDFELEAQDRMTVLDAVSIVQRQMDPSLSYRFACRVGVCGSCAMMVNGKPRWTCRTHVAKVAEAGRITLGPLRNLPVIKDLATDMVDFFDKNERAGGRFVPSREGHREIVSVDPKSRDRKRADAAIECIGCGVCYASCDVVAWKPDYLGPAALNRAWSLVNDERDGDRAGHLAKVAVDAGCHACHSHQACANNCPQSLNPTASIAGLKREVFSATLKGEI